MSSEIHGTTVIAIKRFGKVAMAADGQVSLGNTVLKHSAKKIRRIDNSKVLAGFAGSTADAFALFERFQGKIEAYQGNLPRAAVELAKEWRTDKYLRHLNALLAVANASHILLVTGSGDVIEPDDGIIAIGSGGPYALAAARALLAHTQLDAKTIATEAMKIAADICVFTNQEITVDEL